MDVVSCDDISTKEDYPENIDELIDNKWIYGDVNELEIGQKVKLKYIMNTDGIYNPRRFQNQTGIIVEIKERFTDQPHQGKWITVLWDNNELNGSGHVWSPYSFVKIK